MHCGSLLQTFTKKKEEEEGEGAVKDIAHISFFLSKLKMVSYKDVPLLVCFPANTYRIRHIQNALND
jgi:hypothetical protein